MHGKVSSMWIFGFDDHIRRIPSGVGVHQGDIIATFCYSMCNHPFFKKLQSIMDQSDSASMFYIDDGNSKYKPKTHFSFDRVLDFIRRVKICPLFSVVSFALLCKLLFCSDIITKENLLEHTLLDIFE